MSHKERASSSARASGRAALSVLLASIILAAACASPPRAGQKGDPRDRPDPERLAERALAIARGGAMRAAISELRGALSGADAVASEALLRAESWSYLIGGDMRSARMAFRKAGEGGEPAGSRWRVLRFRLAQALDRSLARAYAAASRADPAAPESDAIALEVMAGDRDIRDVAIASPADAALYATYLSGYRVEPQASSPSAVPATEAATGAAVPVIVVQEPESVDADAASIAVARLAYRDGLIRCRAFRVVDAASREQAVEELELSLSGSAAGERDRAIGGLFAADYVASGSVVRSDPGWLVAYTLSSAGDGAIVASEFAAAPDHAAIASSAARFADALGALARKGSLPARAARSF